MADDSDADDDDSFTVTQIAVTGGDNSAVSSGTTNSNETSITGTYGTLVVGANEHTLTLQINQLQMI